MKMNKKIQFILEPKEMVSNINQILFRVSALLFAFLIGGIFIAMIGANPFLTYAAMLRGAFGSVSDWIQGDFYNLSEVLVKTIPILIISLALLLVFKMLFWNIGANGQFAFGAMAATFIALNLEKFIETDSSWVYLPLMALAGFLAGAFWASIPALLKVFFNVNEIISSLLLNYVAILYVEYLYFGPWRDPAGMGFPGTAQYPPAAFLPRFFGRVHLGLVFGLVIAVILWVILEKTRWGFEIKVIGQSQKAARYAGMKVGTNIVLAMLFSGGLIGLAGMAEVSGLVHRLQQGTLAGYGNTAIIVAWLSNLNVWITILLSFLMAALIVGGDQLQIVFQLPSAISFVLQGIILFVVLIGEFFLRYRIRILVQSGQQE